jgi:hypothetical protein
MRSEAALNELLALAAALAALLAAVNSAAGATLPEQVRGQSQPGGARIPGTSFELAPANAAAAMVTLLQGCGAGHDDGPFVPRLAETLAQADAASRAAPGHGQTGPLIAEVLAVCSTGLARPTDEMHSTALVPPMEAALAELATSLITQFRPDEANRVLACFANPVALAAMPVRDFMALLVRL